jgi:hypothetical protein
MPELLNSANQVVLTIMHGEKVRIWEKVGRGREGLVHSTVLIDSSETEKQHKKLTTVNTG